MDEGRKMDLTGEKRSPPEMEQARIEELRTQHGENIYIVNGNKKNIFWGVAALVTPVLVSIFTFWFGFYPEIATQAYVEKKVQAAPWTKDRPLVEYRLNQLEINYEKIDMKLDALKALIEQKP